MEESLREAACDGNVEVVTALVDQGANLNSMNEVNGWTALHWAAKRGHVAVVKYLLHNGADCSIRNAKNQTALEIALSPEVVQLLGGDPSILDTRAEDRLPITPNYIANPPFPYTRPPAPVAETKGQTGGVTSQLGMGDYVRPAAILNNELVLKIRIANSHEKDFYEAEISKDKLTFEELLSLMCTELHVHRQLVQKIRKLPDTVVRKDKDVQRFRDFQELELVLSNKYISESSRNYTPSVAPRSEDIVY